MLQYSIALAFALVARAPHDVNLTLHACAIGVTARCDELQVALAATFGGTSREDRRLGAELAGCLVRLVRQPTPALAAAVRECAISGCGQLGWVVMQLFTGGDIILDQSPLRSFARSLAAELAREVRRVR